MYKCDISCTKSSRYYIYNSLNKSLGDLIDLIVTEMSASPPPCQ